MPHTLAQNPGADALWYGFLTTDRIARETKKDLLISGFDPVAWRANHGLGPPGLADLRPLLDAEQGRQASPEPLFPGVLVHLGEQPPGVAHYPPLLAQLPDAPLGFFLSGDPSCLRKPAIAVVGTRQPSRDGLRLAERVAGALAAAGFLVVSGLAKGIDAAAHRGALDSGGQTLAVMATGLDRIYPSKHRGLARDIQARGALLTEFCPGAVPHRWHFPRRNRTLAGLCLATVVIEAGRPSGSLITATAAVEQGREVFAAPWSLFHRNGAGCLYLLGQGAQLLETPEQLITQLGVNLRGWAALEDGAGVAVGSGSGPDAQSRSSAQMGAQEARIMTLLGDGEVDLGSLATATGLSTGELLITITRLELAGYVEQTHAGFRGTGAH